MEFFLTWISDNAITAFFLTWLVLYFALEVVKAIKGVESEECNCDEELIALLDTLELIAYPPNTNITPEELSRHAQLALDHWETHPKY